MRLLTLLFAAALSAQDKPDLEKLTSIAGEWTGKIGRAVIEKQWPPPAEFKLTPATITNAVFEK